MISTYEHGVLILIMHRKLQILNYSKVLLRLRHTSHIQRETQVPVTSFQTIILLFKWADGEMYHYQMEHVHYVMITT